jgi:hypothetical protein
MRRVLTIAITLACLGMAGTASAQSGQGGYLGLNPGKGVGAGAAPAGPSQGSGQGGYLGLNPGAQLSALPGASLGKDAAARGQPLKPTSGADYMSSPAAWCVNSVEPSRCRPRAAEDHALCAPRGPERYASCRRTMDYMGWRP